MFLDIFSIGARNGKWQFYIFYREGGRGEKKTVHRTRECFAVTNGLGCRACTVSMGRFEAFMEANSGKGLVRRQSIIFSCVRGIEILVCRCSAGSVFGRHAFDSLHCETADKPRFQSASRRRPSADTVVRRIDFSRHPVHTTDSDVQLARQYLSGRNRPPSVYENTCRTLNFTPLS